MTGEKGTEDKVFFGSEYKGRIRSYAVYLVVLLLLFSPVVSSWAIRAWGSTLESQSVLIPFVLAYLLWVDRKSFPSVSRPGIAWAMVGVVVSLVGVWFWSLNGWGTGSVGSLCSGMLTLTGLAWIGWAVWMGAKIAKATAYRWLVLVFILPFAPSIQDSVEEHLQYWSADAAAAMIDLTQTPMLRDGLSLQLPNITLRIAPECSGIHSSFVLLETAFIAGILFLKSPWLRSILILSVIPLGILRNGFRIATLAMLCVHVDRGYIDSPIHHKGGPIFFGLSLIPFFLLLYGLRRIERKKQAKSNAPSVQSGVSA